MSVAFSVAVVALDGVVGEVAVGVLLAAVLIWSVENKGVAGGGDLGVQGERRSRS